MSRQNATSIAYRGRSSLRILAAEWMSAAPWMRWECTEWWGCRRNTTCVVGCAR